MPVRRKARGVASTTRQDRAPQSPERETSTEALRQLRRTIACCGSCFGSALLEQQRTQNPRRSMMTTRQGDVRPQKGTRRHIDNPTGPSPTESRA